MNQKKTARIAGSFRLGGQAYWILAFSRSSFW